MQKCINGVDMYVDARAWPLSRSPLTASRQRQFREYVGSCYQSSGSVLADDLHLDVWPKLSVVVPSFNQVAFLERTLHSIVNQNYPNLELIVMDAGSNDGSCDVIRRFERHIAFWRSAPDGGQAAAINEGFRVATGEWLCFQNSDDCYLPGGLRRALFDGVRSGSMLVQGSFVNIGPNDEFISAQIVSPPSIRYHIAHGIQFHNQALFLRREVISRVGFFDENLRFSFDFEYYGRLLMSGITSCNSAFFLGAFRRHKEAKTTTISHVGREEHGRLADDLRVRYSMSRAEEYLAGLSFKADKLAYCVRHGAFWRFLPDTKRDAAAWPE